MGDGGWLTEALEAGMLVAVLAVAAAGWWNSRNTRISEWRRDMETHVNDAKHLHERQQDELKRLNARMDDVEHERNEITEIRERLAVIETDLGRLVRSVNGRQPH